MSKKKKKERFVTVNYVEEVKPLNSIQAQYLQNIKENPITFGLGSAGTGKTYIAVGYAAEQLYHRNVEKIVLTRPSVETGKGLGFLPGDMNDKYFPYLQPFEDTFIKFLGKGFYKYALKTGLIDIKPLGFMRGSTFDDCIILADEMQNSTKIELKMLLSRVGINCKMIINGDVNQTDIRDSGLRDAVSRLSHVKGISTVKFLAEDIVRSEICKQIIIAYNK